MNRATGAGALRIAVATSIHLDFDARIWRHARSLAESGCHVQLVCPWAVPDGEVRDGVRFRTFRRVGPRPLRPWLIPPRLGRQLLPILREVDLVHFHDLDILPWMALVSLARPVVYDVHENYPDEMLVREWIPRALRKPLYYAVGSTETALARVVRNCVLVAPSQDRRFASRGLRTIRVYNYATRHLLREVKDDYRSRPDVVVFIGAHHDNNGSMILLDIANRTRARGLELKFLMTDRFASDAFRQRFLETIKLHDLADRVVIRPAVAAHEIMSLLNEATIAISPNLRVASQEKGIHTKLFEYMAAALPIIATDLPGQMEVIGGAEAGMLARPENPETFVDALSVLRADRERAHRLGLNGQRAFLEKYCWESQIPGLIRFYRAILASGTSTGSGLEVIDGN